MTTTLLFESSNIILDEPKAEPFLKWAGGKSQLLHQYKELFPINFNNYIESFVGGGAVFFYLYNIGQLMNSSRIILIDSNEELINTYQTIKYNVDALVETLMNSKFRNAVIQFYKIRSEEPQDKIERAARTIYLNKTCFNGLYRVNSLGKYNVPFGRYKNPLICDRENLEAVSIALQNVEMYWDNFKRCLDFAQSKDFIYFDPPYHPLSNTSNFTSYTKESFGESEQQDLHQTFRELDRRGCYLMLSNSDTPLIRDLYKDYYIDVVYAKRMINCKSSGRGVISELVIRNYR